MRGPSFLALLLAAVAATGGCDLGSDGEDGPGGRPRAAEGRGVGVFATVTDPEGNAVTLVEQR